MDVIGDETRKIKLNDMFHLERTSRTRKSSEQESYPTRIDTAGDDVRRTHDQILSRSKQFQIPRPFLRERSTRTRVAREQIDFTHADRHLSMQCDDFDALISKEILEKFHRLHLITKDQTRMFLL